MEIYKLIEKTRTVRRYNESRPIDEPVLRELIDLMRLGGSARNAQVLQYMIITKPKLRDRIFPFLRWAGYLHDWPGPSQGERPAAYIICLLNRKLCKGPEKEAHFDLGIATQNLLLGACRKGIYGCRIASFSRDISKAFSIDDKHKVLLVLALGYPAEKIVLEQLAENGDVRYWRDEKGVHHVPKRSLDDIILPENSRL